MERLTEALLEHESLLSTDERVTWIAIEVVAQWVKTDEDGSNRGGGGKERFKKTICRR